MVNKRKLSKRRTYGKKLSRRFKKKVSKRVSKKRFSKRFSKKVSKKRMKKRQYNKYVKRGGMDAPPPVVVNEDHVELAQFLGIKPDTEDHLMWIANEALSASLPSGWTEYLDHEHRPYYHQKDTDVTTHENPLDTHYKGLVISERGKALMQDYKATNVVQEQRQRHEATKQRAQNVQARAEAERAAAAERAAEPVEQVKLPASSPTYEQLEEFADWERSRKHSSQAGTVVSASRGTYVTMEDKRREEKALEGTAKLKAAVTKTAPAASAFRGRR